VRLKCEAEVCPQYGSGEAEVLDEKTTFASYSADFEQHMSGLGLVTGKSYKLVCEVTREEFSDSGPAGAEPKAENKKAGHGVILWGINDDGCDGQFLVDVTNRRPLREIRVVSKIENKLKYSNDAYAVLVDGELLHSHWTPKDRSGSFIGVRCRRDGTHVRRLSL
jgi:hypothetical protein